MCIIVTDIKEMKSLVNQLRDKPGSIGFVPTMGALHKGHVSLIKRARAENEHVIVSIFVNPVQFDRQDDLLSYPRDFKNDCDIAGKSGTDIIFVPEAGLMYPDGFVTYVDCKGLSGRLCGADRLGHFKGVATVVIKLFNIVKPHKAYFGQKDFQQTVIIKRIVNDLNLDVEILILPTVRDNNGLACSSRNRLLNNDEQLDALCLYESIKMAGSLIESGVKDSALIIREIVDLINAKKNVKKIDYVSIVDCDTLQDVTVINGKSVIALAVWLGNVRLIDNLFIEECE